MYKTTTVDRPKKSNVPSNNKGNKMELKECITCGSHSFTDNKCDYCGNQYEVKRETLKKELKIAPSSDYMKNLSDEEISEIYSNLKDGLTPNQIRTATYKDDLVKPEVLEITFNHGNKRGDKILSFMLYLLLSIIWFAVTIFIPPLFIITIILLVVYGAYRLTKRNK